MIPRYSIVLSIAALVIWFAPWTAFANTYATWDPTGISGNWTLSSGNLRAAHANVGQWDFVRSTVHKTSGKWYWELTANSSFYYSAFGAEDNSLPLVATARGANAAFFGGSESFAGPDLYQDCGTTETHIGTPGFLPINAGDILGVALDMDNHTLDLYNETQNLLWTHCTGVGSDEYADLGDFRTNDFTANFGATAFATSSVPAGYNAGLYDTGGSNTDTRIVEFSPEEGSTTGNNVTFNVHYYINPNDIGFILGVQLLYENIDQNQLLQVPIISHSFNVVFGQASSTGDLYYSANVTLPDGNYRAHAQIRRTLLGTLINPFSSINDDQSHQFVVNQETYVGHLNQNGFNEFQAILGSTTATSTAAAAATCNPLSFNVSSCLGFLFIPGGPQLDITMDSLKTGVLSRAPWGYFYRFAQILSGTATSSLPSFTVGVVTGPPGGTSTTTLTYDPQDMLDGGAAIVSSLNDGDGHSLRDIMEPFVQLAVALAVVFTIVSDIMGSHRHNQQQPADRRRRTT